ncbi:MAG: NAD-dependent epimerase/dehydratase family protein [Gammaproteobacteria bacterium]|nr:NAD-dependent epimerase/dehydratase family protein [Gammaproteobacteria bacterium]
MDILLTGGSGFVGSSVARALLARGHRVRALVRPQSDRTNLADLPVEYVVGDLTDEASLTEAAAGCAGLFHVAADYRLWAPDAEAMYRANVEGTRTLMTAAMRAGVSRIVYTSSVAVLGLVRDGVADEETPVTLADMIGPYKRSKYLAEEAVRALIAEGLPAVIVNPSTPVGPRDIKPTPTGRIIRDAACGRIPAYVDTGLNVVHVDDVAEGHCLAFERGTIGERYVLGGENLPLRDMLAAIAGLTGRRPPKLRLSPHLLWPVAWIAEGVVRSRGRGVPLLTVDELRMAQKRMFFSSAKAQQALGYRARPAFEALDDAVRWFRDHGYLR